MELARNGKLDILGLLLEISEFMSPHSSTILQGILSLLGSQTSSVPSRLPPHNKSGPVLIIANLPPIAPCCVLGSHHKLQRQSSAGARLVGKTRTHVTKSSLRLLQALVILLGGEWRGKVEGEGKRGPL